jgi:hypothetical protein
MPVTACTSGLRLLSLAFGGTALVGPVLLAAAAALAVIHARLEARTAEGTFPRPSGVPE